MGAVNPHYDRVRVEPRSQREMPLVRRPISCEDVQWTGKNQVPDTDGYG